MRIYNTEPITLGINDLASLKKHHQLPLHLTVTGTGPQPSPETEKAVLNAINSAWNVLECTIEDAKRSQLQIDATHLSQRNQALADYALRPSELQPNGWIALAQKHMSYHLHPNLQWGDKIHTVLTLFREEKQYNHHLKEMITPWFNVLLDAASQAQPHIGRTFQIFDANYPGIDFNTCELLWAFYNRLKNKQSIPFE